MKEDRSNDSKNLFFQIQKVFLLTITIEVLIDRLFYRVGTAFSLGNLYYTINIIGAIARIMMVLLNFIMLGFFLYKKRFDLIYKILLGFELFFFSMSYLFYFINLSFPISFPILFQLIGFLIGGFIINLLMIQKIKSKEIKGDNLKVSIISNSILILLVVIFDFALIHELFFTLNTVYNIPPEFHSILFEFGQVLSVVILCPLIFILPFMFKEKINLKGVKRKLPLIFILVGVIVILGFVDSGFTIETEEHSIRSSDIFAWTLIYVLGFTYIGSNLILLNWAIISVGLLTTGIYLLWIIGKTRKSQLIKQFSYGMFVILCAAFMFVEATDLFFFMELFIGFLILNERESKIKI
jgi:hypothetical protein